MHRVLGSTKLDSGVGINCVLGDLKDTFGETSGKSDIKGVKSHRQEGDNLPV